MTQKTYFKPASMVLAVTLVLTIGGHLSSAFSQDLIVHQTTTSTGPMGGGGTKSVTSTQYLSKNAMKTVSSDGQDSIIRFDTGKIITIDHGKKTYTEMTVEKLNEIFDKRASEAGVDKEKMEQMRKMMGQIADSFSVTKEGPGETIAGYATEKYLIKGPMEMEVYAAPSLKLPALYYDAMKMRVPRNPMFDTGKLYDEMKKINGMPVKTTTTMKMMNMEMKSTTVVTSVEKGSIPASTFEVPAGYKEVPMKF